MTLPPLRILFSTSESLPVPVVARKYDGDFLSSGKFLCMALMYRGISRVGFCLENHVEGGLCRTPNSELPPPETLAYLLNHPRLQTFSFGISLLEPD